jgi:hypothetical protein
MPLNMRPVGREIRSGRCTHANELEIFSMLDSTLKGSEQLDNVKIAFNSRDAAEIELLIQRSVPVS